MLLLFDSGMKDLGSISWQDWHRGLRKSPSGIDFGSDEMNSATRFTVSGLNG
jgi:hypothetical protein